MRQSSYSTAAPIPIGLLIRNKRRELGLSQEELARQVGLAQGSISKLERGLGCEQHAPRILAALMDRQSRSAAEPATALA